MSFRTIAVHVGADRRCAVRIDLAARLAVQQGAHLVGIAPTGLPDVIVAMNSAAPDGVEFIALSAAHLRSQAKAAIVDYEARCRSHALPECASRLVVDEPIAAACRPAAAAGAAHGGVPHARPPHRRRLERHPRGRACDA